MALNEIRRALSLLSFTDKPLVSEPTATETIWRYSLTKDVAIKKEIKKNPRRSSWTCWPLRDIHFSNHNVFFPFTYNYFFVYHIDLYNTWLCLMRNNDCLTFASDMCSSCFPVGFRVAYLFSFSVYFALFVFVRCIVITVAKVSTFSILYGPFGLI